MERRGLWVMDPNRGRTFMRRADYERESSRYVVVYRPTAALRPRRSRVEPGRAARQLVARCGVARARRQLRGGRGRAPPRITAGARARLRSRATSR